MRVCAPLLLLSLTFASTEATNSIKTIKSCFRVGENITSTFSVTSPTKTDWVGITNSSSNLAGAFYALFGYTCGTGCTVPRGSGTVSIFSNLAAGSYKAVLLPNDTYNPLAVSSIFTVQKSCQPVVPTRRPTTKPTPSPTFPPVPRPTNLTAAKLAIQQASAQISKMVQKDRFLLQQYLRLLFHDCHGGICDGCVDMSNPDNRQLHLPIFGLDPIVNKYATPETGLSRADIWVLAMNIALNHANQQPRKTPLTFEMKWIGRQDCEKKIPNGCTDAKGNRISCAVSGPKHIIAPVNMNSLDFANFWRTNFKNVTLRQAIALMGCHTVGVSFTEVSGIDGPNGWDVDNLAFNNGYFQALLGTTATPNMTVSQLLNVAPGWTHAVQTNAGTALPVRHFWTLTTGGKKLIMTVADIAAVRQLDTSNTNGATGQVGCAFAAAQKGQQQVCPAANTIQIAAEFLDNDKWMTTVKEALDLMTTNGYKRGPCAAGQLCVLG